MTLRSTVLNGKRPAILSSCMTIKTIFLGVIDNDCCISLTIFIFVRIRVILNVVFKVQSASIWQRERLFPKGGRVDLDSYTRLESWILTALGK